jgi:ankyrin repeat protein
MAVKIRWSLFVLGCLLVSFVVHGQEEGETPSVEPLIEAIRAGQLREVRRLLEDGADPNVTTEGGTPVIVFSALHGLDNIATALIEAQADVNAKNKAGASALAYAAEFGHNDIVKALLDAGADVNVTDTVGWTPLIYAAMGGNATAAAALVEAGADVNAAGFFGRTAAQVAESRGATEVLEALGVSSGS